MKIIYSIHQILSIIKWNTHSAWYNYPKYRIKYATSKANQHVHINKAQGVEYMINTHFWILPWNMTYGKKADCQGEEYRQNITYSVPLSSWWVYSQEDFITHLCLYLATQVTATHDHTIFCFNININTHLHVMRNINNFLASSISVFGPMCHVPTEVMFLWNLLVMLADSWMKFENSITSSLFSVIYWLRDI